MSRPSEIDSLLDAQLSVDRIVLSQPVSSVVPSLQRGDDRKLRAPVEPARFDPF
jgi:hypothetical protein